MKVFNIQGYTLWVGENAIDNWNILGNSKPWYYFFHLSSFSSGYGILLCEQNEKISRSIFEECSERVMLSTKYRNVKVDYTKCDNVKKGESVGIVYYKNNKKVMKNLV
jgi:hypothetical protein